MRPPRPSRSDYAYFRQMTTRWRDNDVYGHLNNAVYYEYVDAAVNAWIIESGALQVPDGPIIGLVVTSGCTFHAPLGFPAPLDAGLRVGRVGRTSVTYEVGLFASGTAEAAAAAHFVHVYVARDTRTPVPLPEPFQAALAGLSV